MEQNEELESSKVNNAKQNTLYYLPALLEITAVDTEFPWDRIDDLFTILWKKKAALAIDDKMKVDATFFFTIMAARKGHSNAIGILHFLNHVFEELAGQLNPVEKKMLCSNIKDMVTTSDLRFYDFVGEIATLNNLMKTKAYRLERVETPLPNGKTIDFQLCKIETNCSILVEIVNIHLDSDRVEADPVAIDKFLTHRLVAKIKDKNKKLKENVHFYLVPVLWGGWQDIEVYSNYFRHYKLALENVIEPVAYLQHSDGQEYYDHQFGRVSTLHKSSIVQRNTACLASAVSARSLSNSSNMAEIGIV